MPASPVNAGERDAELWMRRMGLPYFVRPRHQASNLPGRVAPFIVFLITLSFLTDLVVNVDIPDATPVLLDSLLVAVAVALVLVPLVAPVFVGILSARILRRRPRSGMAVGIGAMLVYVVVFPFVPGVVHLGETVGASILFNGLIALAACALTALGIGSLVSWAARTALSELAAFGALATRALPLLLLLVLFAFFARPLWEVTSSMSALRLLLVVLFFIALGLLFAIPVTRRELTGLEKGPRGPSSGPALSGIERFNLSVVMVLAQGVQIGIVALLVTVFLIVLGVLAFSPHVLTVWLGGPPETVRLLGLEMPISVALLKTAIFLSCVSSLNFLVSLTTGSAYRTAFYEPMLEDARTALLKRAAYRAAGDGASGDRGPGTGGTYGTGGSQPPERT